MSQVILKKSSVAGKVPLAGDLVFGELALNYADGILYFKDSANNIGTIGGASSITSTQISNWDSAYSWGNHASAGYLTSVTSSQITSALGFTPYSSTNPSNFITSASLSNYLPLTGGTLTGVLTATGFSGPLTGNVTGNVTGSSGSCTGNAASASSVSGLTLSSSAGGVNPNDVTQNQIGYNTTVSLFGQTDGGLYSSAHSSSWIHQIYGDFRTGQIAIRGKNNGTWQAWRSVLDSGNYSSYALPVSGGTMSGTITGTTTSMAMSTDSSTRGSFICRASGTGDANLAGMTFWNDSYAIKMGIRADGYFGLGGWSRAAWSWYSAPDGSMVAAGNVTAYSDEKLKKNWRDLPSDFIEQLALVKHGIYDRVDEELTQVGVSAQSLQKVLPDAVMMGLEDTLTVAYGNAAMVSSVKLAERIVEQDARIAKLEALIEKLLD